MNNNDDTPEVISFPTYCLSIIIVILIMIVLFGFGGCERKNREIKKYTGYYNHYFSLSTGRLETINELNVEVASLTKEVTLKEFELKAVAQLAISNEEMMNEKLELEKTKAFWKQKELAGEVQLLINKNNEFLQRLKESTNGSE